MPLMTWNAGLSVGDRDMDRQHQHLIDILNTLHEEMLSGQANAVLTEVLDQMLAYTISHFAAEEALMARCAYPGLASHKLEHQKLVAKAQTLSKEWKQGRLGVSLETSRFLRDWLQTHIVGSDKKYSAYVQRMPAQAVSA